MIVACPKVDEDVTCCSSRETRGACAGRGFDLILPLRFLPEEVIVGAEVVDLTVEDEDLFADELGIGLDAFLILEVAVSPPEEEVEDLNLVPFATDEDIVRLLKDLLLVLSPTVDDCAFSCSGADFLICFGMKEEDDELDFAFDFFIELEVLLLALFFATVNEDPTPASANIHFSGPAEISRARSSTGSVPLTRALYVR